MKAEMNFKYVKRGLALSVFLLAGITYYLTAQPSVSFWDCGDILQQHMGWEIPHPPGAPLFLILARVVSMMQLQLILHLEWIWSLFLPAAAAVLLLYLIIIKIIEILEETLIQIYPMHCCLFCSRNRIISSCFAMITCGMQLKQKSMRLTLLYLLPSFFLLLIWNEKAGQSGEWKIYLAYSLSRCLSTSCD